MGKETPMQALVFVETKVSVEKLTEKIKNHGFTAEGFHRQNKDGSWYMVQNFATGTGAQVLVATRSLTDAQDMQMPVCTHMIIYDMCELTDYRQRVDNMRAHGGNVMVFF